MQTTTIKIHTHTATLTADHRALYQFQGSGGRISALFDVDQTYVHGIRLVHALLDPATREHYPEPESLCQHVGPDAAEVFQVAFETAHAAGWFPTADELRARIAQAQTELATPPQR
jgi:hypothetical protein